MFTIANLLKKGKHGHLVIQAKMLLAGDSGTSGPH